MKKIAADPNDAAHDTIRCTGGRSKTRRVFSVIGLSYLNTGVLLRNVTSPRFEVRGARCEGRGSSDSNLGPRTSNLHYNPRPMRWSRHFINTLRESPADAEVISQKLMMRAGMI